MMRCFMAVGGCVCSRVTRIIIIVGCVAVSVVVHRDERCWPMRGSSARYQHSSGLSNGRLGGALQMGAGTYSYVSCKPIQVGGVLRVTTVMQRYAGVREWLREMERSAFWRLL